MSRQEIEAILNNEAVFNQVVRSSFESVDKDGSGFIDESELRTVLSGVTKDKGRNFSDSEVSGMLRELDSNRDGRISIEEYKALIRQVLEIMKEEAS